MPLFMNARDIRSAVSDDMKSFSLFDVVSSRGIAAYSRQY